MRWVLGDAQGGTFVDAEFGIDQESATESQPHFDPRRRGATSDAGSTVPSTASHTPSTRTQASRLTKSGADGNRMVPRHRRTNSEMTRGGGDALDVPGSPRVIETPGRKSLGAIESVDVVP